MPLFSRRRFRSSSSRQRMAAACAAVGVLEPLEIRQFLSANAVDDSFSTPFGTPLVLQPSQLLANDIEVLKIISATQPANGTLSIGSNGSITYTPGSKFSGTDTFSYTGQSEVVTGPGHFLDFNGLGLLEVSSFSWGAEAGTALVERTKSDGSKEMVEVSRPGISSFFFTAALSAASAGILTSVFSGEEGTEVDLVSRDSAGKEIHRFHLENPRFESYAHSDGPGDRPIEAFSINATSVTISAPAGASGAKGRVETGFDLIENKLLAKELSGAYPLITLPPASEEGGLLLAVRAPSGDAGAGKLLGALPIGSVSFGLTEAKDGGAGGAAPPDAGSVSVSFEGGSASVAFLSALLENQSPGTIEILAGAGPSGLLRHLFVNPRIETYQGSGGGANVVDSIQFSYGELITTATPADGKLAQTAEWDVEKQTVTPLSELHFGNKLVSDGAPMFLDLGTGQVAVSSFGFGGARGITSASGADRERSTPEFSAVSVTLSGGIHLPALIAAAASATPLPEVALIQRGEDGKPRLQYELKDVVITNLSTAIGADGLAQVSLTLTPRSIGQTVTLPGTGTQVETYTSTYDLAQQKFTTTAKLGGAVLAAGPGYLLNLHTGSDNTPEAQIRIEHFSLGLENRPDDAAGSDRERTVLSVSDAQFGAMLSAASAGLFAALGGEGFARLELIHRDGKLNVVDQWVFHDGLISNYAQSAAGTGLPAESFGVNFTAFEYQRFSGKIAHVTNWDVAGNKAVTSPRLSGAAPDFPLAQIPATRADGASYLLASDADDSAFGEGAAEILSFSFGSSRTIEAPIGSQKDREASSPSIGAVQVVLPRTSPLLAAAVRGAGWGEIVLLKVVDGIEYRYTLTDARVQSVGLSESAGGSAVDVVTLTASAIRLKATPLDDPGAAVEHGYDAITAQAIEPTGYHFGRQTVDSSAEQVVRFGTLGEVEVVSVQWGVAGRRPGGEGGSSGNETTPASFSDVSFTVRAGLHSPGALAAALYGKSAAPITFISQDAGGKELVRWTITEGVLSSHSLQFSADGGTETFTINAVKVELEISPNDQKGDQKTASVGFELGAGKLLGGVEGFGGYVPEGAVTTDTATVSIEVDAPAPPPPPDLELSRASVAENAAAGTVVGTVTSKNLGALPELKLTDDAGGRFALDGDKLVVADGALLDFESDTSHTVTISAGEYFESFEVGVSNVNEAPVLGFIADAATTEGSGVMFVAAATDPDAGAELTFSLTSPAGVDAKLTESGMFLFSPKQDGTYAFTVTVSDGALADSQEFTITVTNKAPSIGGISNSGETIGGVQAGRAAVVTLSFSDAGSLDRHTASIDWGDGTTTPASVSVKEGNGKVTGSHVYASAGIYTATLTLSDGKAEVKRTLTVYVSGVAVREGVLYVIGSGESETVQITPGRKRDLSVRVEEPRQGRKRGPKRAVNNVLARGAKSILILAGDGDDRVAISSGVAVEALVDGGGGHDYLNAGRGSAILVGGTGNDTLLGGKSRDLLIGGRGRDVLNGGGEQDILVGAATAHDGNFASLKLILEEWTSPRPLVLRMANIGGPGLPGRANGNVFLNGDTILTDADRDVVQSSAGSDWVLMTAKQDKVKLKRKDRISWI